MRNYTDTPPTTPGTQPPQRPTADNKRRAAPPTHRKSMN